MYARTLVLLSVAVGAALTPAHAAAPSQNCLTCEGGIAVIRQLFSGPSIALVTSELKAQCDRIGAVSPSPPNVTTLVLNCKITVDQMIPDVASYLTGTLLPEICVAAGACEPSTDDQQTLGCGVFATGHEHVSDYVDLVIARVCDKAGADCVKTMAPSAAKLTMFGRHALRFTAAAVGCSSAFSDPAWDCRACMGAEGLMSDFLNTPLAVYSVNWALENYVCEKLFKTNPLNLANCKAAVTGETSAVVAFLDAYALPYTCESTCDMPPELLRLVAGNANGVCALVNSLLAQVPALLTSADAHLCPKLPSADQQMCHEIVSSAAYRHQMESVVVELLQPIVTKLSYVFGDCKLAINDTQGNAQTQRAAASSFPCDVCEEGIMLWRAALNNPLVKAGLEQGAKDVCPVLAPFFGAAFEAQCMFTAKNFADDVLQFISFLLPQVCTAAKCPVAPPKPFTPSAGFNSSLCATFNFTNTYGLPQVLGCAATSNVSTPAQCNTCKLGFNALISLVSSPAVLGGMRGLLREQCATLQPPIRQSCIAGVDQFLPQFFGFIAEGLLAPACDNIQGACKTS